MCANGNELCDYSCLAPNIRIKLSWQNGLKCFIQPKLHLSISGHAKAYEPLVKLRRLCSGNIQGLILEDVLVNPVIANYHKLLNVLMQSKLTRKPSPASEPVPETPTFSDRSTSGWWSRAPGGKKWVNGFSKKGKGSFIEDSLPGGKKWVNVFSKKGKKEFYRREFAWWNCRACFLATIASNSVLFRGSLVVDLHKSIGSL